MQGTTVVTGDKKKKIFDSFSIFLVAVVAVSVVIAVVVYRSSFGAGLSVKPDSWSAFGSYIGGVFGPLISFLTLLAILKTIGLQKELLDTQRTEFEAMQALQMKAIDAQLTQMQQANNESERRVLEEYRISLLRALDNCAAGVRSEYQDKRQRVDTLFQWSITGVANTSKESLQAGLDNLKRYEKRLALMMLLYGEICCEDFDDVASMKKYYDDKLSEIWKSQPIEPEEVES
ncbi:hypothetical protein ACN99C_17915 [Pseudomonas alloputida]|uniref:hypothetical protein n=1 Tax=Pseudomonas alloputida TaxID=1940621 RepID=UPI003B431AC6